MITQENLTREQNARLIIDFFHRIMMHHVMWFAEVQDHLGKEKALKALNEVYKTSYDVQMKRLSKTLGFEMKDGIPASLLELPEDTMNSLRENVAANWLANDGIWFQTIEFMNGMTDAKSCNDSCWEKFSPLEAWSIKRFLNLPENPGLEGLKQALHFRLYAFINKQSVADETENSFIFRLNDCRVQSARKRKGLDDYPCKSAGRIEYSTFAEAIDHRIRTECIACPPDKHPDEWYCAWKFFIQK
ncbi:MAG: DUF6125 family protein [Bacteroidota bacterium]